MAEDRSSDDEARREAAIVEEAIAALRGEPPTGAADHERDRRRVRVVLHAIEDAR